MVVYRLPVRPGAYLALKAEAGELDRMYAYARGSLLAFAAWMVEHEVPYFDRPEKLDFPTETWAAQELRKANVLRLAAQHADAPLRGRLIARGGEFAERAWSDLVRFPSRDVARSVALVMAEGPRDSYWRRRPIDRLPIPAGEFQFGPPQAFQRQKRRVLEHLKTPSGALQALRQTGEYRRWWRFLGRGSRLERLRSACGWRT